MSFLNKLFRKSPPPQRVRICVECGMPVAEHKSWCSILQIQQERAAKSAAPAKPATSSSN